MTALRLLPCLSATLLLSLLASVASSQAAPSSGDAVILDGGKSWAALADGVLVPLPMPEGDVLLHKAVQTPSGRLATGIERVGQDGGAERLLLMQITGDTAGNDTAGNTQRLPVPKQRHDAVTYAPTPILRGGELAGLVWIEGFAPNRTRVLASDWTGSGWSQPVAVSEFGAGTQIALDVARLSDGSLLAVWAAFDGEDDEIVWARTRNDGTWSTPRPITENSVPDVTPTLMATKGGAVVAWSGYDGNDYRIQLSHLTLETGGDGGSWSAPALLESRGGVWPLFQALGAESAGGQTILTWRQAVPRTWMAAALAGEKLLWTSPAPQPPAQLRGRPLAETSKDGVKDGGIRLLWPIASADGLAKTEHGAPAVLAETLVSPAQN